MAFLYFVKSYNAKNVAVYQNIRKHNSPVSHVLWLHAIWPKHFRVSLEAGTDILIAKSDLLWVTSGGDTVGS